MSQRCMTKTQLVKPVRGFARPRWSGAIAISLVAASVGIASQPDAQEMTAQERHRLGRSRQTETETAALFAARSYTSTNGDAMPYRLLEPLKYDPEQAYPLVVCLSGSGGRGDDNVQQIGGCWPAQVLAKESYREKYPCFVLAPQCPSGEDWASVDSLVLAIIRHVEIEYTIDSGRRYVTGQSMGGSGSWHFMATQPDLFAAAVPICGGKGDTSWAATISHIPVWAFHGSDDVPSVDLARSMINAIKKAGGTPHYTEFPGVGHISWPLAYDTPGLLDWLFAQRRHTQTGVTPTN